MNRSLHHGLAGVLVMLISMSPLARGQQGPDTNGPKLGEAAPEFTLSNIEGKRLRLKDYRGKKNLALVFYPALFRAGG